MEFCNEPGCLEFAQADDPETANTLKFKCERHEATARARGETGIRPKIQYGNDYISIATADGPPAFSTPRPTRVKEPRRTAAPTPTPTPPAAPAAATSPPAIETPTPPTITEDPMPRAAQAIEEINEAGDVISKWPGGIREAVRETGIAKATIGALVTTGRVSREGRRFRFAGFTSTPAKKILRATKKAKTEPAPSPAPEKPRVTVEEAVDAVAAVDALAGLLSTLADMAARAEGGHLKGAELAVTVGNRHLRVYARELTVSVKHLAE